MRMKLSSPHRTRMYMPSGRRPPLPGCIAPSVHTPVRRTGGPWRGACGSPGGTCSTGTRRDGG